jgi:hypothetical protein
MDNTNGFSSSTPSEYLHNLNAPSRGAWTSGGIAAIGQVRLGSNYQYYYPGSNWGVSQQTIAEARVIEPAITVYNRYGQNGIAPRDISEDAQDYLDKLTVDTAGDPEPIEQQTFVFNSNVVPANDINGVIDCTEAALADFYPSISEEKAADKKWYNDLSPAEKTAEDTANPTATHDGTYTPHDEAKFVPDSR